MAYLQHLQIPGKAVHFPDELDLPDLKSVLLTSYDADTLYTLLRMQETERRGASYNSNQTRPSVEKGSGDGNANQNEKTTEEVREKDVLRLPWKISWFLYVISANNSLLITVGYWTLRILFEVDEPIDGNNITKHSLNSVFMVIDTFLSSIPVHLFHSVYPLLYVIVYIAFTVVYWKLGGTNYEGQPYIYKLLDYSNFEASTGCIITFSLLLVQPVLQLMLFGLVRLRDHLSSIGVGGTRTVFYIGFQT